MKKATLAASIAQLRADVADLAINAGQTENRLTSLTRRVEAVEVRDLVPAPDETRAMDFETLLLNAADICRPVPVPPTQRRHDAPLADDEAGRYLARAIAAENERDNARAQNLRNDGEIMELRDQLKITTPPAYIAMCKRCLGTDNSENLHIACERVKAELEAARAQNVVLTGRVTELEGNVKSGPTLCRCNVCGDEGRATIDLIGAKCPTNLEGKVCSGRIYPVTSAPEPQPATEPATRPDQITAMRNETQKAIAERDAAIADLAAVRSEASAEITRLKGELAGKAAGAGAEAMAWRCEECGREFADSNPVVDGDAHMTHRGPGAVCCFGLLRLIDETTPQPPTAPKTAPNDQTPVKAVKTPQIATEAPKTGAKPRRPMSDSVKTAMASGRARKAAANAPGIDPVWQNADGSLKTLSRAEAKALTPQQAKARKKQQQAIYAKRNYEKKYSPQAGSREGVGAYARRVRSNPF